MGAEFCPVGEVGPPRSRMWPHPQAPTAYPGKQGGEQKEDLMVSPRLGPQKSDGESADRGALV